MNSLLLYLQVRYALVIDLLLSTTNRGQQLARAKDKRTVLRLVVAEFVNFDNLRANSVRNGLQVDYRFQL